MTQEQWIIYLYSIYPSGGITTLLSIVTGILMIVSGISWLSYKDKVEYGGSTKSRAEENFENNELTYQSLKGHLKIMALLTTISASVGYFIPDKNTFVAIVATPSIVRSYTDNDGKLNKIDSIIDKILERTELELSDGKSKK